jgi:hypothetical protein
VLEPRQSLAIIGDVVEEKLTADELARIHGIPREWIEATLGQVTRWLKALAASCLSPPAVGMRCTCMSRPMRWRLVSLPPLEEGARSAMSEPRTHIDMNEMGVCSA